LWRSCCGEVVPGEVVVEKYFLEKLLWRSCSWRIGNISVPVNYPI